MPAAPSLEILFDTQAAFESAIATYFTANGLTAYTSKGTDNMEDQRIIVQFLQGGSQGHKAVPATTHTGWHEQDMFSGQLVFSVQSERSVVDASPVSGFASIHDYWVARIKVLMLRGAINGTIAGVTALALPYFTLPMLNFADQTPRIEGDVFDETLLSWSFEYQIKADAWPA